MAFRTFGVVASIAQSAAQMANMTANAATGGTNAHAQAISILAYGGQLLALGEVASANAALHSNELRVILHEMTMTQQGHWHVLEEQLGNVRKSVSLMHKGAEELELLQAKAKRRAAVASGADFYRDADGKIVTLPVNTVLRRQYDGTAKRYDRALKEAKYLAFLARRAIEQRLGVPLDAMTTPVGPLDAPSIWADDLCTMAGLDYEKLRTAAGLPDAGADAATDEDLVNEYADSFIGDYVTKLGNLVEYYNVAYPSHDGDDTAVLSLKEDLLPPIGACVADATNLLHFSGRLDATVPLKETVPAALEPHWQVHDCESASKCLRAVGGAGLVAPKEPPAETIRGQVTWLVDHDPGAAGTGTPSGVVSAPTNVVSQEVMLTTGDYVLSWWDQARDATGALATSASKRYRVEVYGPGWGRVGESFAKEPHVASGSTWSERRKLPFHVNEAGVYRVGFGASLPGEGFGSVAIANVQLERVSAGSDLKSVEPTAYIATESSREVVTTACKARTASDLRASFRRACSNSTCWYELIPNLIIDTARLTDPGAPLAGKIARGNFNFRHITLAVNLVGSGVRSCDPGSPASCYGSGFTEYTLRHDGTHAGIIDWDGTSRQFDFGIAPIEHGKALAAERYITLPISSADQGLITQPGIEKGEYRGRPLDGIYSLKVWDDPALRWDRLDDVQIILKYRYWSRLDKKTKTE